MKSIEETQVKDISEILNKYDTHIKTRTNCHLGYPYNLSNQFPMQLLSFIQYSINNLGDPFIESNYGIHSRPFEIAVLNWFANLWQIPKDEYWGYVGCSGTEGNFSGLLIARDNLPKGILYASEESHYSVFKACHLYKIAYEKVKCNEDGTMNINSFVECLSKYEDSPAIVNVNIGTTMKGGIDNIDQIISILKMKKKEYYIHCDSALSGIIEGIDLNFNKDIHSISVSGHKFLGCPFPCGVIITRKRLIEKLGNDIDYIGSRDSTIMGSRNGHAPIFMWYLLVLKGQKGLLKDYEVCVENAKFLEKSLFGKRNGITVVLKKPKCVEFIKKWQLACTNDLCHIVIMPNVKKAILQKFIEDYKSIFIISPDCFSNDINIQTRCLDFSI